jgi:class 3 adenylate cyclase/tetratricopeptide (TPR) repeat protein
MKCPRCSFENIEGMSFCGRCGSPLRDEGRPEGAARASIGGKPAPKPETLDGERRKVTVLFADISGYTSLSEQMDPEDLANLANELFQRLGSVIGRYEGTVDKYMGDCVMAIFGAPVAHENDPERALRVALEMMTEVRSMPQGIGLHIGVNSGEVLAGKIGSDAKMEYTVMGDAVNVAQRLTAAAPSRQVYVSPSIHRLTKHLFEFEELAPLLVKGKRGTISAHRLKGLRKEPALSRGIPGLRAHFLGRDKEMEALEKNLSAVNQGNPRTVIIVGEAGVGKSRLLSEFRRCSEKRATWLEGRCSAYGTGAQFQPFLPLLREALLNGSRSEENRSAQWVTARMKDLFPDRWTEVASPLARILSLELEGDVPDTTKYLDPRTLRLRTFVAIRDLLATLSQREPLVVAIDDLHWADESSQDLMRFLVETARESSLLLIGLTRPGSGSWWEQIQNEADILKLEGLTKPQMERLMDLLLEDPEIKEDVKSGILEKSGGSPFCLEEIIKSLIENETLAKRGEKWVCERKRAEVAIPETVEAVIASRLDKLRPETRELLRSAAVLGDDFSRRDLDCMTAPEGASDELFEQLKMAGLVAQSPGSAEKFCFTHPLIQEVAYATILKADRKDLHLQAARCTEQNYAGSLDERFALLARHYDVAGVPDKAFYYYTRAGRRARETFANSEAVACFSRGLEIAAKMEEKDLLPEMIDMTIERGRLHRLMGQTESALRDYNEALRLAHGQGLKKSRADAFLGLCHIYAWTSRFPEMERASAQALELYRALGDSEGEAKCLSQRGYARQLSGDIAGAIELHEQSLFLSTATDNKLEQSNCLNNLGAAYSSQGDLRKGLVHFQESLEIKRHIGDLEGEAANLHNLGYIQFTLGNLSEALALLSASIDRKQRIGDKAGAAVTLNSIGTVHIAMGQFEKGLDYCQRALKARIEVGDVRGQGYSLQNISRVLAMIGPLEEAVDTLKRSLEVAREVADREGEALVLTALARIAIDEGRLDAADDYLGDALRLAHETGAGMALLKAESESALLALLRNSLDQARAAIEKIRFRAAHAATPEARALGLWLEACLCARERSIEKALEAAALARKLEDEGVDRTTGARWNYHMATLLHAAGAEQEARGAVLASAAVFRELGAAVWTQRLKQDTE